MANTAMATLGFLAGLTTALERLNEKNTAERAATTQYLGEQGYEIAPARPGDTRPANVWTRLLGGSTAEAVAPGTFVAELGGRPFIAQRPPPVEVEAPSGTLLTPQEQEQLSVLLAPYQGQAATPQARREVLQTRLGLLRQVQEQRRQEGQALAQTKLGLLGSIRGHPEAAELAKPIREAQSLDDLLALVPTLPSLRAVTSRIELAYQAAAGDETAQEALQMLPREQSHATLSSLAFLAEGGGEATPEDQAQAKRALATIRQMRVRQAAGRRKGREKPTEGEPQAEGRQPRARRRPQGVPPEHPTTFQGEQFEGRGRSEDPDAPQVKSFRRIR